MSSYYGFAIWMLWVISFSVLYFNSENSLVLFIGFIFSLLIVSLTVKLDIMIDERR